MVAVPFLFFLALTIYWWKKHHGLDVCVYMSGLYAMTTFCAIFIVAGGFLAEAGILFDETDLTLGFIPTVLFCALLFMGMYPFSLIYNKEIESVKYEPSLVLDGYCILLFIVFLLNIYLILGSTADMLQGDLSLLREEHYAGVPTPAEIKAESLPFVIRLFFYFNSSTIFALPLFFYYNCFSDRPLWFKTMLLLTSLSMPISGLQVVDRTEFLFYGMMFVYCLIFFWKFLAKSFKIKMLFAGVPVVAIVLVYLVAVTQARFAKEEDDEKAYMSVLQYAGQSYLNFCFFWENGKTQYIAPEREFPMTWHTLFGVDSNPQRRDERSGQQGFFMSVFATYVGDVMLDLTPIGAIIWCIAFFIITLSLIRYNHRTEYDIGDILAIFMLAAIPIFGIFYYRYFSFPSFYMLLSVIVIMFFSKHKVVYQ